jgi:predicted Zn-dependent protease
MMCRVFAVALLTWLLGVTGWSQSQPSGSVSQESSSKEQPVDVSPPPGKQQPTEQQSTEQDKQKSSTVTRKMDEALPDCVNLIFYHGCRHSTARQREADEKQQQKLAEAAERCKQLIAALPAALTPHGAPATPENNPEFSSSTQYQAITHPYCTPEDVVAADHDVDVGDFNFKDKNYKGAEMRYRSALERIPGEPVATLHLARVLEKLGNKAEAYREYKIYLQWSPTGKEAEEANAAIARLQKELALK